MKECKKCKMVRLCAELDRMGYTTICRGENPANPIKTNADRIRAMSDEELARWLAGYVLNITDGRQLNDATAAWLDWLKQEVRDGDD